MHLYIAAQAWWTAPPCVPVEPSLIFPGMAANASQMLGPLPSVAFAPSICEARWLCDISLQQDTQVYRSQMRVLRVLSGSSGRIGQT